MLQTMILRVLLACTLLAAGCSKKAEAGKPLPGGGYSYLVTPGGRMFRVLGIGPATGAGGKKLGMAVSYAGETARIATITADAEELAAALGPDMEAGGETALIIQANVGYDPRKVVSRSKVYNVLFERQGAQWLRLPSKVGEPEMLDGIAGSPTPPEDPSFPFDADKMKGAAEAAVQWVALIDGGDVNASVAAMGEDFRSQVPSDAWRELVAQRSGVGFASRVERYRMQTRNANFPVPPSGAAVVQYDVRPAHGDRFIERVMLVNEKGTWRVEGYAVKLLPVD